MVTDMLHSSIRVGPPPAGCVPERLFCVCGHPENHRCAKSDATARSRAGCIRAAPVHHRRPLARTARRRHVPECRPLARPRGSCDRDTV